MTAHSAIFTTTRTQHMESRLSTLDCLSQIETLILDPACDEETRTDALTYAAAIIDGVETPPGRQPSELVAPLTAAELRAVIDDFDIYFLAD